MIRDVKCLPDDSVALVGYSAAPTVFGGTNLPKGGVIARLDSAGKLLWARTPSNATMSALVIDAQTNILVGGLFVTNPFQGPVGFVFAKMALDGSLRWSIYALSDHDSSSYLSDMSMDGNGGLSFCGYFQYATAVFGRTALTNGGLTDAFVGRLATEPPTLTLGRQDGSLQVSWPIVHGNFVLEQSTVLTNWSEVPFTTNSDLGIHQSSNQMQAASAIFRLKARD